MLSSLSRSLGLSGRQRPARRALRAVSLLEMMVVVSAVGVVSAGVAGTLGDQVRRARANDAANKALFPHQIARDRAVASRHCTETVLLEKGEPNPATLGVVRGDPSTSSPRIAIHEYNSCAPGAVVKSTEFFPLDGDITLGEYNNTAGTRLVYGIDGGINTTLTSTGGGGCVPAGHVGTGGGGGGLTGGGTGSDPRDGSGGSCSAGGSTPPLPEDVTFTATTFFGAPFPYRVYARVGAIEKR